MGDDITNNNLLSEVSTLQQWTFRPCRHRLRPCHRFHSSPCPFAQFRQSEGRLTQLWLFNLTQGGKLEVVVEKNASNNVTESLQLRKLSMNWSYQVEFDRCCWAISLIKCLGYQVEGKPGYLRREGTNSMNSMNYNISIGPRLNHYLPLSQTH